MTGACSAMPPLLRQTGAITGASGCFSARSPCKRAHHSQAFKTGEAWQPHAGSVRLRGRSADRTRYGALRNTTSSPMLAPAREAVAVLGPVDPPPVLASLASPATLLARPANASARSLMPVGGATVALPATPASMTSIEPAALTVTDGATIAVELPFAWPLEASTGLAG